MCLFVSFVDICCLYRCVCVCVRVCMCVCVCVAYERGKHTRANSVAMRTTVQTATRPCGRGGERDKEQERTRKIRCNTAYIYTRRCATPRLTYLGFPSFLFLACGPVAPVVFKYISFLRNIFVPHWMSAAPHIGLAIRGPLPCFFFGDAGSIGVRRYH